MNKKFKVLIPVIFASIAMTGCDLFGSKDENAGYYKGYNLKLKGQRLEQELQKLCFEKHINWVQYGQVNTYFKKTPKEDGTYRNSAEALQDGSEYNQYFYTGKEDSGHGTREHVWPCAKSSDLWYRDSKIDVHKIDKDYYVGGGSDLYHIRTCSSDINTARGDSKFCNFKDQSKAIQNEVVEVSEYGGKYTLKVQGGSVNDSNKYQFADLAEPDDKMKGDVARIILYVYIHYKDRGITPDGEVKSGNLTYHYYDFVGGLSLTNVMGYKNLADAQKVLKEWNELDPPSKVEKLRNNTVQRIQGNRNPLVDHPELVNQLF